MILSRLVRPVDRRSPGRPDRCRAFSLIRHSETIYDPLALLPVLARKPGVLRNGAPFKDWVLPADPCLFMRVSRFSALNDRLEAAINHAFAVEWHGVPLGLHAGIGHHLVPSRLARHIRRAQFRYGGL